MDEAKDYHLMPDRRGKLHSFKSRPRCCSDVAGVIYAVGGLTSLGKSFVYHLHLKLWHYHLFIIILIKNRQNAVE